MTDKIRDAMLPKVIAEVCRIVSDISGIQLGEKQVSMVESRLKTRMGRLGINDSAVYLEYLNKNVDTESQVLLSLLTTHHTFFFREFSHFEYLLNKGIDPLIKKARARGDKKIRIWSAACSKGQEVYSLAMFFQFHLAAAAPDIQVEIYGSDVDPESVAFAQNGVYKADELKTVPAMYMQNYWIRGTGTAEGFFKAGNLLRGCSKFQTGNLQSTDGFLSGKCFDVIICRNVFIYFNQDQIRSITTNLLNNLDPDGFLFLGVSESLNGLKLPLELMGPSVYCKPRNKSETTHPVKTFSTPRLEAKQPYKLLCVDDSSTIHALLGKIFSKDSDFKIAATAKNGREALEILKTQKFDAITLDLHMPEMDGITFLEQYKDRSAPILILSSVNREEASLGKKAISLGAFDYVEKPSLENMVQASNEIRSKLKTGIVLKSATAKVQKPAVTAAIAPVKANTVSIIRESSPVKSKIKVLIVDDSKTIRHLLENILSKDPDFIVVGQTEDPLQVERLIGELKPDLMTLDIHMPKMDGVTLLKRLPAKCKIPTVMISSISKEEGPQVLEALENGAVDYIQKPEMSELLEIGPVILERLKEAARAKVGKKLISKKIIARSGEIDPNVLVLIGSSTGGTEALRVVLESMPKEIPPILIVQHIPPVFSKAFADRLNQRSPFEVREAEDGDEVHANRVLIAPGGKQMSFHNSGGKWVVKITDDAPVNRHKPSVDFLFKSVVDSGHKKVVAAILTGMGADGAREMLMLRKRGARTIAQDQESCVVFGMPKAAIEKGAAEFVLPLDQIAGQIDMLVKSKIAKAA